jgi:hypothetical protein
MLMRKSNKHKNDLVIINYEKNNGALKRRKALRPNIIKEIKVREPSSMPENNSNLTNHENSV